MTEQRNIGLYDHSNYQDLQWPQDSQYEHDYLSPLLSSNVHDYVSNVQTCMLVLKSGEHLFPLTINDSEYDNSYVCSPYTRYVTYAQRELSIIHNRPLKYVCSPLISGLGIFCKASAINKVVCVNNWLLSTNLYPNMDGIDIKAITDFLVNRFPKHTLMFPSLNRHTNASLMGQLEKNGYQLVPQREVYIFDRALKDYANRRVTQTDLDLLKTTPYQVVSHEEITEGDCDRIVELYRLLYIEKYSDCNPKFSLEFIKLCRRKNLLNFRGLRSHDKRLVGVIASFTRNGVLATPLVGYDTQLPANECLYRMLTALSIKEAMEKGLVFNMSSGVSEFKKWRGGVGFVEYFAIYHKHLPLYRRQMWNTLQFLLTQIGVPLLHKYRF